MAGWLCGVVGERLPEQMPPFPVTPVTETGLGVQD